MVDERPKYKVVVTHNSPGRMDPDVKKLVVDATRESAGEVLVRCQATGSKDSYNWLIDLDGTVYELAGWDRATWARRDAYSILLVQLPGVDNSSQSRALGWLLGQLEHKKGIPRQSGYKLGA